jgi:hypothetical protein
VLRDDALRMAGRRKRAAGCHVERRGWRVMLEEKAAIARASPAFMQGKL